MSVALSRGEALETFQLSANTGIDDQGKTAYGTSQPVKGRVLRADDVVRLANGSEVATNVTIWVPATETYLPDTDDRVVLADGLTGIVIERTDGKTLQNVLDHVRVKIREE